MGKLIVELPGDVHRELKKKAAANNMTLKDIITELIHEYLSATEKGPASEDKTCLCGVWDDDRAAEEIIKDIKTHRKWLAKKTH